MLLMVATAQSLLPSAWAPTKRVLSCRDADSWRVAASRARCRVPLAMMSYYLSPVGLFGMHTLTPTSHPHTHAYRT